FEIERVEQGAPPVRRQMTLEIRHRAQRPGTDPPVGLPAIRTGTGQTGTDEVRLGKRRRTVRLLGHVDLPRISKASKKRSPEKGKPRRRRRFSNWRRQHRSRPTARSRRVIGWSADGAE